MEKRTVLNSRENRAISNLVNTKETRTAAFKVVKRFQESVVLSNTGYDPRGTGPVFTPNVFNLVESITRDSLGANALVGWVISPSQLDVNITLYATKEGTRENSKNMTTVIAIFQALSPKVPTPEDIWNNDFLGQNYAPNGFMNILTSSEYKILWLSDPIELEEFTDESKTLKVSLKDMEEIRFGPGREAIVTTYGAPYIFFLNGSDEAPPKNYTTVNFVSQLKYTNK